MDTVQECKNALTMRAWFSGVTFSRNTLLCNLCCSTWGFLDKTLRISATIFCTYIRDINNHSTTNFNTTESYTVILRTHWYKQMIFSLVKFLKRWLWYISKHQIILLLTFILWTSKWLMARWVLMRQWVFWVRFLTTFTVNLWFGMCTASRSSPLTIVGDHQPTCCMRQKRLRLLHKVILNIRKHGTKLLTPQ